MGNEPPKKNYVPRLEKQKLEISCIKVIAHLELQRDRRQAAGNQKEKALVSMINAPQRSKVDEVHKASSLVTDIFFIEACNIIIRFCNIIKDRSLLICESVGKPQNIEQLMPFIESVIWSSRHLNLNALSEFNNMILFFFGAQGIDVTTSPKVDDELRKCLETVMPTPEDLNNYILKLTEKTGIPLEQINQAGHNFARPPPPGQQQQQQPQPSQFNQPPQQPPQQPSVGGYYPPPQPGQGGPGGYTYDVQGQQHGQVINVNVQIPPGQQQYNQQFQPQQQQNQYQQVPSSSQFQPPQPPSASQFNASNQHQQPPQYPTINSQNSSGSQNQFSQPPQQPPQNQFQQPPQNQFQQPPQNQFQQPPQQQQPSFVPSPNLSQVPPSNSDNSSLQQQFANLPPPQFNQPPQQPPQQASQLPPQQPPQQGQNQQFQQAPQYQNKQGGNGDIESLEERLKRLREGV